MHETERNYGAEIDSLRREISEIKSLFEAFAHRLGEGSMCGGVQNSAETHEKVGHIEKMPNMHPDQSIMSILDRLENKCGEDGSTGRISYIGVFASGGRQSTWVRNEVSTDTLLPLIENKTAEKVLSSIGNNDRLNILLSLLRRPMTVTQLVEDGGYESKGQVYHHLKPLIAADLIFEDRSEGKGVYAVVPHRVQGIIMLLAGISDMVDPTYTAGEFEE